MEPSLDELMALQAGVVARRQLLARGWADHDIARQLRRRSWATVHEGVYVDHTGEPTWLQLTWAAVLFSWPAALSHGSALRASDGPGRRLASERPLHVLVERNRRLASPPGVVIHRRAGFGRHVQWHLGPPRVRFEQAALDVAVIASSELDAIDALSRAVQSRRTTPARLRAAMAERERLPRRAWLSAVLLDLEEGTCSVLEHGYRHRVEAAHRLPRGLRQETGWGRTGRVYRDVAYDAPLIVELDGRLFHDSARGRDRDFDRDLLALVDGRLTTRLSWGQVFDRPCWTAAQVGVLLHQRGWRGAPQPCGLTCDLAERRCG